MAESRDVVVRSVISTTDSDNDSGFKDRDSILPELSPNMFPQSIASKDHKSISLETSPLIETHQKASLDIRTELQTEDPESKNPFCSEWITHEKHAFVCSTAGKPIYTKYGQISELASFIALLHSLISFYQTIKSDQNESDELVCIKSKIPGNHNFHLIIYFMIRSPLYLIQIYRSTVSEPIPFIKQELLFLYEQIIGLTSTFQMERVFRANYDVSRWIAGHENILDRVIPSKDSLPSWFTAIKLDAIPVYPMSKSLRKLIGQTFESFLPSPTFVLFGMLISLKDQSIVYLYDPMKRLSGIDIFCILNRISSIETPNSIDDNNEIWTSICCPKYLPEAFLHMYYFQLTLSMGLMLCTDKRDGLDFCSEISSQWSRLWSKSSCVSSFSVDQQILSIWPKEERYTVSYNMPHIDGLLHFIYVIDRLVYIPSAHSEPDPQQLKRWIRHYKQLIYSSNSRSIWFQGNYETAAVENHHNSYTLYVIMDYHVTEHQSRKYIIPKLLHDIRIHLKYNMSLFV